MRGFNSTVALLALVFSLLFFGQGNIALSLFISAVAGIVFALLSRKRTVIAFDSGGVMTEGDYFTEEMRERKGMRALVKKLREKYRVVLLSNQNALAQKAFDRKFGFRGLFDEQVISGEIGLKKPDKGIFNYILERFNIRPSQLVFIDDQAENVESAKALGINALHFTSVEGLVNALRKLKIAI